MRDVTNQNFGYLIAYVLPGFVALWGLSYLSPTVEGWLGIASPEGPTVGGFLYVTIGSVGAGLLSSTVRWMVIDTLHHHTGLRKPEWDFAKFANRVEAFSRLVADHYAYYKFYGNSLIALLFAWVCRRLSLGFFQETLSWLDLGFVALIVILFIGSRDTIGKYYDRSSKLLAPANMNGDPVSTFPRPRQKRERETVKTGH